MMMKIRCDGCDRIVEIEKEKFENNTCKECGGSFSVCLESEETDNQSENEEFSCDECGEDFPEANIIEFPESGYYFCKSCIEKNCKGLLKPEVQIKEKIVPIEKVIYLDKEGVPLNANFNLNEKSKFD